ncbi:MAG: hypothetical protein AAF250_09120 [Pseudomonadota bacterium]
MIGSQMNKRRGSPLALIGLLVAAWVGGRVMLWENPFPVGAMVLPELPSLIVDNSEQRDRAANGNRMAQATLGEQIGAIAPNSRTATFASMSSGDAGFAGGAVSDAYGGRIRVAAGHQLLWAAALSHVPLPRSIQSVIDQAAPNSGFAQSPPFAPPAPVAERAKADRWSLDAWAFWRQGSNSTAISQGRVPIYGASQVGASLQYRLAPTSSRDPRAYVRAYRALVSNGETEVAAGVSARPVAALPIRAFAEARVTDNAFDTEVRPAAFAVTELPPVRLPLGVMAEAYGQAGYVGGDLATPFADGQLAVTREVTRFDLSSTNVARLSVGAGAWGGAQDDAARIDVGPTMRIDMTIGEVPARLSLDWREQVAGDASPGSGAAVTLSTRF